jgi:cytidylate kinase
MIITLDGPAGSGKTSTAKRLAHLLGFLHLDTGAMYRAITLTCLRKHIPVEDTDAIARELEHTQLSFRGQQADAEIYMDGENVSREIRSAQVTAAVSDYCVVPVVREALVAQQRAIGARKSLVCEGRDMGTVVFPDARYKFYLVADITERAKRRQKELEAAGTHESLESLEQAMRLRDAKDSSRKLAPLKKAADAVEIDTTGLGFDEQVAMIMAHISTDAHEKFRNADAHTNE